MCRSCGTDYSPPKKLRPFHLAFPVDDVDKAKQFYVNVLGCTTGREKEESCVFKFFGHQIVAHLVPQMPNLSTNPVDGKQVPAMHFGLVMEWNDWHQLKDKLEKSGVEFIIGPDAIELPKKSRINQEFTYTFEKSGVYFYQCTPHKSMGMIAVIIVGDDLTNLDQVKSVRVFGKSKRKLEEILSLI